jgi:hypothetical protein
MGRKTEMGCYSVRSGWLTAMGSGVMAKWQDEGDEEGLFWKFVAALIPQIDPREKDELMYEHDGT